MKVPLTVGSWLNDARLLPLEELCELIRDVVEDVPTDERRVPREESCARRSESPHAR